MVCVISSFLMVICFSESCFINTEQRSVSEGLEISKFNIDLKREERSCNWKEIREVSWVEENIKYLLLFLNSLNNKKRSSSSIFSSTSSIIRRSWDKTEDMVSLFNVFAEILRKEFFLSNTVNKKVFPDFLGPKILIILSF